MNPLNPWRVEIRSTISLIFLVTLALVATRLPVGDARAADTQPIPSTSPVPMQGMAPLPRPGATPMPGQAGATPGGAPRRNMIDADFVAKAGGFAIYNSLETGDLTAAKGALSEAFKSKRRLADGMPVLGELFVGYEHVLADKKDWDVQLDNIRKWRASEPESADAALIEAGYWIAYAWDARGTQFGSSVPEAAFKLFHERIKKAGLVLTDAKSYASVNPMWYRDMLLVALAEGWPAQQRLAVFQEGVKREPYFYPIYFAMAISLSPRWGGSLTDYESFVDGAVALTGANDGKAMAARLYWNLSVIEGDKDPFTQLKIPWPDMKAGFDDLIARTPQSEWNAQNYAYFACVADDKDAFMAVLPKLNPSMQHSLPPLWYAPYTFDYCVDSFTTDAKPNNLPGKATGKGS